MQPRDERILEHIVDYCEDVQDALSLIECSYEVKNDRFCINSPRRALSRRGF